jgi:hypothetical protein
MEHFVEIDLHKDVSQLAVLRESKRLHNYGWLMTL